MAKVFVIFVILVVFVDKPWQAQERVFRSGVDGVTITVSVRSNNRPVGGLTAADFVLTDNGVEQELSTLAAEKVPLDLTLLLDLSSSVDGPLLQRLKTAVSDTASLLRSDDRIRLVTISQVLHEVFSLRPRGEKMPFDTLVAEGATSLYDGMAATMMRASVPGRRQLIVAFSDGRDSTSIIDEKTAEDIARLTDAVVDIVVPSSASGHDSISRRLAQRSTIDSLPGGENLSMGAWNSPDRTPDDPVMIALSALVKPTAGQVFALETNHSISRAFKAMFEEFRASYVLQYVPQGVAPDGWHDVSVTLARHGKYEIRNRKGYQGRSKIPSEERRR